MCQTTFSAAINKPFLIQVKGNWYSNKINYIPVKSRKHWITNERLNKTKLQLTIHTKQARETIVENPRNVTIIDNNGNDDNYNIKTEIIEPGNNNNVQVRRSTRIKTTNPIIRLGNPITHWNLQEVQWRKYLISKRRTSGSEHKQRQREGEKKRNGEEKHHKTFTGGEKKQDGNVPSRRHILSSKIFKEQLLEKFGKNFFSKKILIFFSKESIF